MRAILRRLNRLTKFLSSSYWQGRIEAVSRAFEYAKLGYRCPDYDHTYFYEHIIFKLKRMEYTQRHGMHVDKNKCADQIKIARLALERLAKDDYGINDSEVHAWNESFFRKVEYQAKEDLKLFAKQFVKYSRGWWD